MNTYAREMQEYKAQSINTMTPGELLILLYDELLKRLKRGNLLLEQKDYSRFEDELTRCQDIIRYLKKNLNRKYSISGNLVQLYDYFNYQLIRAKAGRKKEIVDEVTGFVTELRDSFRQANQMTVKMNGGLREGNLE